MPWFHFLILSQTMSQSSWQFLTVFMHGASLNDSADFNAGYRKNDHFTDQNAGDEILARRVFGYVTTRQRFPQSCQVESAGENMCT